MNVLYRFGNWKVLHEAYEACASEKHARLFLAELSTGSTKLEVVRGLRLNAKDTETEGLLSDIEVFDAHCLLHQSQLMYQLYCKKFRGSIKKSLLSSSNQYLQGVSLTRTTYVEVSSAFESIYDGDSALSRPRAMEIIKASQAVDVEVEMKQHGDTAGRGKAKEGDIIASEQFQWVSVITRSRCMPIKLIRSSLRYRIVVVPGDVMLSSLIKARETLGPPPDTPQLSPGQMLEDNPVVINDALLPYCHEVVHAAVLLFFTLSLPNGWTIECSEHNRNSNSTCILRYQVVLEDFCSPISTHAASGRLAKKVSLIDSERILSTDDYIEPATMQLEKKGEHFSVSACKDISVILPKLLPMLILYLNSECGNCTVIQTKNRKETKKWIETFGIACHEDSLLF